MVPVVEPRRRLRAPRLRRKPSCSIAASTRPAVSGWTAGSSFTTLETVLMLTPASRATSFIVARRLAGRCGSDNVVIDADFTGRPSGCQHFSLKDALTGARGQAVA